MTKAGQTTSPVYVFFRDGLSSTGIIIFGVIAWLLFNLLLGAWLLRSDIAEWYQTHSKGVAAVLLVILYIIGVVVLHTSGIPQQEP
jgi:hypothetical protein